MCNFVHGGLLAFENRVTKRNPFTFDAYILNFQTAKIIVSKMKSKVMDLTRRQLYETIQTLSGLQLENQ